MRVRRIAFFALALTILGAVNRAPAKPNFSGEWKMNSTKSSFAPLPAPAKLVRKITHEGPSLKMSTTQSGQQGDVTTELSYTTDGKECKNKIRGQEVTGHATWDGDNLIIESKREAQGMEITQSETWTLSEDRQTITIANHVTTPQGAFEISIVLEKQ